MGSFSGLAFSGDVGVGLFFLWGTFLIWGVWGWASFFSLCVILPVYLFEFVIPIFFQIWRCTLEKLSSPNGSRALWRRPTVIGDFFDHVQKRK